MNELESEFYEWHRIRQDLERRFLSELKPNRQAKARALVQRFEELCKRSGIEFGNNKSYYLEQVAENPSIKNPWGIEPCSMISFKCFVGVHDRYFTHTRSSRNGNAMVICHSDGVELYSICLHIKIEGIPVQGPRIEHEFDIEAMSRAKNPYAILDKLENELLCNADYKLSECNDIVSRVSIENIKKYYKETRGKELY